LALRCGRGLGNRGFGILVVFFILIQFIRILPLILILTPGGGHGDETEGKHTCQYADRAAPKT
jgi:predicted permease